MTQFVQSKTTNDAHIHVLKNRFFFLDLKCNLDQNLGQSVPLQKYNFSRPNHEIQSSPEMFFNDIAYKVKHQIQEQGYPATEIFEVFFVQKQNFEPLLKESLLLMQTEQCQSQHAEVKALLEQRMHVRRKKLRKYDFNRNMAHIEHHH